MQPLSYHPPDPKLAGLLKQVRGCTLCAPHLALGPRPVLQMGSTARILIAAQAPGRKVHESGIPFDDASGERLRQWMGLDASAFYDPSLIAILPMGFCYPGRSASGDLPPRPECAPRWRAELLAALPAIELTLVIGRYAMAWHLGRRAALDVTDSVRHWRDHWPRTVPMPHPSPRNNPWLKRNPWFEQELVPQLQARVRGLQSRH